MRKTFLMCEPMHYDVSYEINPHMNGNIGRVDRDLAHKQWKNLHSIISNLADIELIAPAPNLPDMVFTANAGVIFKEDNIAIVSTFAKRERRAEERLFQGWFIAAGFGVVKAKADDGTFFEGAGDCLRDLKSNYWIGFGMRTTEKAIRKIMHAFDYQFRPLELCDPRFYHLDTCLAPLSKGHILCYPDAFTTPAYWSVAMSHGRNSGIADDGLPPPDMVIEVDEQDAMNFACNTVCIDDVMVMPKCSEDLMARVRERGYDVVSVDLSEFIKAGGAAKCLTLQIR